MRLIEVVKGLEKLMVGGVFTLVSSPLFLFAIIIVPSLIVINIAGGEISNIVSASELCVGNVCVTTSSPKERTNDFFQPLRLGPIYSTLHGVNHGGYRVYQ